MSNPRFTPEFKDEAVRQALGMTPSLHVGRFSFSLRLVELVLCTFGQTRFSPTSRRASMRLGSLALLSLFAFSAGADAGTVICASQQVPAGFVIVKAGSDQSCPGWTAAGTNTFEVELPSDGLQVCLWQTIPSGWVIVKTGSDQSCPGWNANGPNVGEIRQQ
jgi:hypothetical protein